jgi:hypothetical protein
VSEADSLPFSAGKEHDGITVDQFNLGEVDGDDTVFLKCCVKNIQAFTGNPTADAKNDTVFIREPVDSAGHNGGLCPGARQWQIKRRATCTESAAKAHVPSIGRW